MTSARSMLVAIVLTLCGCHAGTQCTANNPADLDAIKEYDRQWLKAINTGDMPALSALTADEHITFPSNAPPNVGKAANDAVNSQTFQRETVDEHWSPADLVVACDWAYERGSFTSDATPKAGGPVRKFSGNYLRILRRQKDGSWKMIREMATSDRPEATN